jgi:hypothetical protein
MFFQDFLRDLRALRRPPGFMFVARLITALAENHIAHLRCLAALKAQSVPALKSNG